MTMGAQAAQNLYIESLGYEGLESCPVFKKIKKLKITFQANKIIKS